MLDRFFQQLWYSARMRWLAAVLLPLSWLFGAVAALRRRAYGAGFFRSIRVSRPVVVIGNVTVGGVGKTPLTIWLAARLAERGAKVAVVLRGYGGRSKHWPCEVTDASDPREVGDEPVLIAGRTPAIVVVGPDRVADAQRAVELGADIILCDDGLQHYRLVRDREIAVVDEQRGLGNGWLLPAGPLREPARRLREVDLIVATRRSAQNGSRDFPSAAPAIVAANRLAGATCLSTGEVRPLERFMGARVHAIAAIGNPESFFGALRAAGLDIDSRAFSDHARLTAADLDFQDDAPVLMTEKDAVKCRGFADPRFWAVRLELDLAEQDAATLLGVIAPLLDAGTDH